MPRRLEALTEVVYTPLEGRVDACVVRQSVWALQPRHLVIIGGPKSNALMLVDDPHKLLLSGGRQKQGIVAVGAYSGRWQDVRTDGRPHCP